MCWMPGAGQTATFCVDSRHALQESLAAAAHNGENDRIRIVAGTDVEGIHPVYEAGFNLVIENGFDMFCQTRMVDQENEQVPPSVPVSLKEDAESIQPQVATSGPFPPVWVEEITASDNIVPAGGGTLKTLGVPAFLWYRGCGPTVVAMVLAYWDLHGMDDLFPGSATYQSYEVNKYIASEEHYQEYSEPLDVATETVQEDYSELATEMRHLDNSIADFMHTSWSIDNMRYGWSLSNMVTPALNNYTRYRNSSYHASVQSYHIYDGTLRWDVLTREIDSGRPLIFLVDTDGDAMTDHFVTVVGYRTSPTLQYGCLDTWHTDVQWHDFAPIQTKQTWGIWGGWSYDPGITIDLQEEIEPIEADLNPGQVSVTEIRSEPLPDQETVHDTRKKYATISCIINALLLNGK